MPQRDQSVAKLFEVGPFEGLDLTTDPMRVLGQNAVDTLNHDPSRMYGALGFARGRKSGAAQLTRNAVASVAIFHADDGDYLLTFQPTDPTHLFQVSKLPLATNAYQDVLAPAALWGTNVSAVFAEYGGFAFFTNKHDTPAMKIAGAAPTAATPWQIAPPLTAPGIVQANTANALLEGRYWYRQTFGNSATSQESSPSPITVELDIESTFTSGTTSFTFSGTTALGDYFLVTADSGGAPLNILEQVAVPDFSSQSPTTATSGGFVANLNATQVVELISQAINSQASSLTASAVGTTLKVTSVGAGVDQNTINVKVQGFSTSYLTATPTVVAAVGGGTIPAGVYNATVTLLSGGVESPLAVSVGINLSGPGHIDVSVPPALASLVPSATAFNTYLQGSGTGGVFRIQSGPATAIGTTNSVTTLATGSATPTSPSGGVSVSPANHNIAGATSVIQNSTTVTPRVSTDAQVDSINVYRIGGTLSTWSLVKTLPNLATPFVDILADADVIGQPLILHQDPPPPFIAIERHKERLFGFGYTVPYAYTFGAGNAYVSTPAQKSDLWYTRYANPFAFDAVNQVIPLGRSGAGDVAVGLHSLSNLFAWKTRTLWAVAGDSEQDFRPLKVGQYGCVAPASIAGGDIFVLWVGIAGVMFMQDGGAPANISDGDSTKGGIRAALVALRDSGAITNLAGAVCDNKYFLADPSTATTYVFDLGTGRWTKLSFTAGAGLLTSSPEQGLLFGLNSSNARQLDQWVVADGDLAGAMTCTWTSGNTDSGEADTVKNYSYLVAHIPASDPANTIEIDLYVDGKLVTPAFVFNPRVAGALPSQNESYFRRSLPAGARGTVAAIKITMTAVNAAAPPSVSKVTLHGSLGEKAKPSSGSV